MAEDQTALNEFQILASQVYGGGDFEGSPNFRNIGDGLYTAVMVELSSAEDCESQSDAVGRLETMITDLQVVAEALGQLDEETAQTNADSGLNSFQLAAKSAYQDGVFSDPEVSGYKDVGDTFYTAVMTELATTEDCTDLAEASHRMQRMIADVQTVLTAVENMPSPATGP
jgi:hypothetical protein